MAEAGNRNASWSDDELTAALDAYLYMLRLELSKIPFSVTGHSKLLLSGTLHKRSEASVRYRMRNISHVLSERGLPTLIAFSAAQQVGRNVTKRLLDLLDSRAEIVRTIRQLKTQNAVDVSLSDVLHSLSQLKERVSSLEDHRTTGIGHNNPPDDIDFSDEELTSVTEAIRSIENEIAEARPDHEVVQTLSQRVSAFGLKVAVWCGQRLTDFARATAVAAGTGFGLSLSGLDEQIVATLKGLFQLVF